VKKSENIIKGVLNRLLQNIARLVPGSTTLRVWLHRWRGVRIGKRVWIGYDAIIETSYPYLVEIKDDAVVGIRATIIGHFKESTGVVIEESAFLGPGVIVMPNVKIGKGAVVTAGSVVTTSVSPMTMVQGNPAKTVATVGVILDSHTSMKQFVKHLRSIHKP